MVLVTAVEKTATNLLCPSHQLLSDCCMVVPRSSRVGLLWLATMQLSNALDVIFCITYPNWALMRFVFPPWLWEKRSLKELDSSGGKCWRADEVEYTSPSMTHCWSCCCWGILQCNALVRTLCVEDGWVNKVYVLHGSVRFWWSCGGTCEEGLLPGNLPGPWPARLRVCCWEAVDLR